MKLNLDARKHAIVSMTKFVGREHTTKTYTLRASKRDHFIVVILRFWVQVSCISWVFVSEIVNICVCLSAH